MGGMWCFPLYTPAWLSSNNLCEVITLFYRKKITHLDYVANLPTCGPLLILSPALKRWGLQDDTVYVANLPSCGPLLILSPALKHWGPQDGKGYVAMCVDSCGYLHQESPGACKLLNVAPH